MMIKFGHGLESDINNLSSKIILHQKQESKNSILVYLVVIKQML